MRTKDFYYIYEFSLNSFIYFSFAFVVDFYFALHLLCFVFVTLWHLVVAGCMFCMYILIVAFFCTYFLFVTQYTFNPNEGWNLVETNKNVQSN